MKKTTTKARSAAACGRYRSGSFRVDGVREAFSSLRDAETAACALAKARRKAVSVREGKATVSVSTCSPSGRVYFDDVRRSKR